MRTAVILTKLEQAHVERLASLAKGWRIVHGDDKSEWEPFLAEAEIVGGWNKTAEKICLAPGSKLRWIHNWGAGVDRFPFDVLRQKGIVLTNSSGIHAYPISETIFAMMLAFTRNLHVYIRNQSAGKWISEENDLELHEKTLGVIGVGAIGTETAKIAKAFGMKVLGVRRSGEAAPYVDRMFAQKELDACLGECDYVVNTLPFTDETRGIFGEAQFRKMKPGAFYVNIGRGRTTDQAALIEALKSGRIAGAGLDVFEQEPLPADSPLWSMDNVIVTPHTSGATGSYNERVMEIFLGNFARYLLGDDPHLNRVDLQSQY